MNFCKFSNSDTLTSEQEEESQKSTGKEISTHDVANTKNDDPHAGTYNLQYLLIRYEQCVCSEFPNFSLQTHDKVLFVTEAGDLTQIQIHHGDEHNADVKRISNRKRADNGGNLMLKQNLL